MGELNISVKKARVNQQIRVPEIRLIDAEGEQVGIIKTRDALIRAEQESLDLVEISPNAEPPVCRLMDHAKYVFEQKKKQTASKKKQVTHQTKEVKFRPTTDIGDFQIKMRKINTFLERGDKVKVSLRFRGREMQHKELGLELLERVKDALLDGFVIEQMPKLEGRQMSMVVAMGKAEKPVKKPKSVEQDNSVEAESN